jgi:hypothetical protein
MKRTTTLILTALVALAVAGLAIAQDRQPKQTAAVVAAFTATATGTAKSTTCTGADGTYKVTRAAYEGTSTGDPKLAGKVALRLESVVNETNGLGWTKGKLTVRDAAGKTLAKTDLVAVNTAKTVLNGFVTGRVKDSGRLYANFSGAVVADGSSVTGELGAGAALNSAVVTGGGCERAKKKKKDDGDDD